MTHSRIRRLALVPLLAVLCLAPRPVPAEVGPTQTVERLDALYLEVMKQAEALGYEGRYQKLAPALAGLYDFPAMARLSVGSRWSKLSPEQQRELARAFGRLTAATYARRFVGYDGERFEIVGEEPSGQGTVLVRTRVEKPDAKPLQLDYRLRQARDGWRVIDVFFDGTLSELALRRSEYAGLLDREGFDGLLAALEAHVADLAAGREDARTVGGAASAE